jgi:hypothetical protein
MIIWIMTVDFRRTEENSQEIDNKFEKFEKYS